MEFADDCVGEPATRRSRALAPGEVLLLENLRFHAEEEANDPAFAKQLAALADVYVNDAFGTAHRAHASTEGITRFVAQAASGYLMKKELDYLGSALGNPARPFVAIIGGSKVSSKIDVIKHLLPRVDQLLLGGGMTYTFLKAQGLEVGKSIVENDKLDFARELLAEAGDKLVLPDRFVVTDKLDFKARTVGATKIVAEERHPAGLGGGRHRAGLDRHSSRRCCSPPRPSSGTGPVGVFEIDATAKGTMAIAELLAKATAAGRHHHHRRRRLGVGRQEGRRGQQGLARVDRRRRFARIPRGQGPAGCRSALAEALELSVRKRARSSGAFTLTGSAVASAIASCCASPCPSRRTRSRRLVPARAALRS